MFSSWSNEKKYLLGFAAVFVLALLVFTVYSLFFSPKAPSGKVYTFGGGNVTVRINGSTSTTTTLTTTGQASTTTTGSGEAVTTTLPANTTATTTTLQNAAKGNDADIEALICARASEHHDCKDLSLYRLNSTKCCTYGFCCPGESR